MNELLCKRIYDAAEISDGYRILVDRLWPRGVKKEVAAIDSWRKDLAPTSELRNWFAHMPERYDEFTTRYIQELNVNPAAKEFMSLCIEKLREGNITLLYAAKNEEYNNAIVLRQWLEAKMKG